MNRTLGAVFTVLLAFAASAQTKSSQNPPAEKPSADAQVPVIDGAVGPCSLELTILGAGTKPVYNATVKVHITYGLADFTTSISRRELTQKGK